MWEIGGLFEGDNTSRPNRRLHSGFFWSFTGNVVNGFSQWVVLALIARLANPQALGEYALAVAVATPVAMLAHLNLRSVLATDVGGLHPFADYLTVRKWVGFFGMAVSTVIGLFWTPWNPVGLAIILAGLSLGTENFQDLFHGAMQRAERLDRVAQSMILRGVASLTFVAGFVYFWPGPVAAAAGLLAGRVLTLFLFDRRRADVSVGATRAPGEVFRAALPLGLTLMLGALTVAMPRYVLEHRLGASVLGIFVAVNSFVTMGSVAMNALGQSATTRLARAFESRQTKTFRLLVLQLTGLSLGIGLVGCLIAAVAGDFFLGLIYGPQFREYRWLLVRILMAGTLGYVAAILGYVVTSTRQFRQQLPLLAAVALTSAVVCFLAIPRFGVDGAVAAVAAAALVQISGNLILIGKARS